MKFIAWSIGTFILLYIVAIVIFAATFDSRAMARRAGELWRGVSDGFSEGLRRP